jgi:hypothetical protein
MLECKEGCVWATAEQGKFSMYYNKVCYSGEKYGVDFLYDLLQRHNIVYETVKSECIKYITLFIRIHEKCDVYVRIQPVDTYKDENYIEDDEGDSVLPPDEDCMNPEDKTDNYLFEQECDDCSVLINDMYNFTLN